jgi:hypothetical protein
MTSQPSSVVAGAVVTHLASGFCGQPAGYSVAVIRTLLQAIDPVSVRAGDVSKTAGSS